MELEDIERKQMEVLHIAQIKERNKERKMSEDEKRLLAFLENKYYGRGI